MSANNRNLCPNCSNPSSFVAFAVIAPWIKELIAPDKVQSTSLLCCERCSLRFFSHRYTETQLNSIYSNYRGATYVKVRRKFEPWYTEKLSKTWDPGENPIEVMARKDYLKRCFDSVPINLGTLTNALDFGGDLGQFFPSEVDGKKYLFDPSGVEVSDSSIERISDLGVLAGTCGLIMNCHTLEHLPLPSTTVEALRPILSLNGYLYIELPYDTFRVSKFHSFNIYRSYINFIAKYSILFMLIDFLGGVYRNFFRRIPFWGIVKQSEHINYYNRESLTQLCELNDLNVIKITGPDFDFGQGYLKLGRLSVIAKAKKVG